MNEDWEPAYRWWRHGGWYVINACWPGGAALIVTRNCYDGKWRIYDQVLRENSVDVPTYRTRDAAARAAREYVRSKGYRS